MIIMYFLLFYTKSWSLTVFTLSACETCLASTVEIFNWIP